MRENEYYRTGYRYAQDGKLREQCPYEREQQKNDFLRGFIKGTLELKKQKKENV